MSMSSVAEFFTNIEDIKRQLDSLKTMNEQLALVTEQLKTIIFYLEAKSNNGKEI